MRSRKALLKILSDHNQRHLYHKLSCVRQPISSTFLCTARKVGMCDEMDTDNGTVDQAAVHSIISMLTGSPPRKVEEQMSRHLGQVHAGGDAGLRSAACTASFATHCCAQAHEIMDDAMTFLDEEERAEQGRCAQDRPSRPKRRAPVRASNASKVVGGSLPHCVSPLPLQQHLQHLQNIQQPHQYHQFHHHTFVPLGLSHRQMPPFTHYAVLFNNVLSHQLSHTVQEAHHAPQQPAHLPFPVSSSTPLPPSLNFVP